MDNKKIFVFLFLGILMISMASAFLETKSFDKTKLNYGEIQIRDWAGLFRVADYKLTDYDASIINVWAEGTYKLYKDTTLFDDVYYKNVVGKVGNLRDVKFFIWVNESYVVETPIYEQKCTIDITSKNETQSCTQIKTGTKKETKYKAYWKPYKKGTELKASSGKWRLTAKRPTNKPIDFILKAHNKEFVEWAWWDNNWNYKREIKIQENSGTSLSNYSVLLHISYDSDMNTDFSDLRFVNSAETDELNYWIDNKTDSSEAWVWVKIPTLTASLNTSIYMYYGNSGATTTSNGNNAFLFYDNFSGSSLNTSKWTYVREASYISVSSNIATLTDTSSASSPDGQITSYNLNTNNVLIQAKVKPTASGGGGGEHIATIGLIGSQTNNPSTDDWIERVSADSTLSYITDGTRSYSSVSYSTGTEYNYKIIRDGSTIKFYINGVLQGTNTDGTLSGTYISFYAGKNSGTSPTQDMREVLARTYVSSEPTYYIGAEQSANSLSVNLNSPINYYNSSSQNINFDCNATDETGVLSLNLTINNSVYATQTGDGTTNLSLTSTETLSDGFYSWYCKANDDTETKNSSTRYLTIDATDPTISTASNLTNITTFNLPTNSTWSFDASDTHIDSCYYNTTDHSKTIVTCNSTIQTQWATQGEKEITYCANDTFGHETCNTDTINIFLISYDQTGNPDPISEGFDATFNLTVNMTNIPTTTANLIINNTVYTPTTTANTNGYEFGVTVTIPDTWGSTTGVVQDWYWNYSISGVTDQNTSTENITVYELAIDDCSSYGDLILEFNLNDEETSTAVNESAGANVEIDLKITSKEDASVYVKYNKTWINENNPKVCLPNNVLNNSQYWIDFTVGFDSTDHVWEFYYLDDGTLNSTKIFNSQTKTPIDLMDLLTTDSTSFLFNYFDQDGLPVDDAMVHVYRRYIGEGEFKEVERAKADLNGDTIIHLVEEDVIYYFVISQYGKILYTSSQYTALCQATPCTIQIEASGDSATFDTDWDLIDGGGYTITSDPSTRTVNLTYSLNDTSTMNLTIFKYNSDGSYSEVQTGSDTGSSGSIILTVPQGAGNVSFFATVYQDDDFINSEWVDFEQKSSDYIGSTLALFLGALIILTLGLMAITEGVGTLIFVILGVALAGFLGLVTTKLSTGVNIVVYLVVAGGILLWKLTRGRN